MLGGFRITFDEAKVMADSSRGLGEKYLFW